MPRLFSHAECVAIVSGASGRPVSLAPPAGENVGRSICDGSAPDRPAGGAPSIDRYGLGLIDGQLVVFEEQLCQIVELDGDQCRIFFTNVCGVNAQSEGWVLCSEVEVFG